MEIGLLEQKEIARYFKLNERVMENKVRIKQLREMFYDQSLMSHVAENGMEVVSLGFSLERNVIPFVDTLTAMEMTVKRLSRKKRYLDKYLNGLHTGEKEYLINRYTKMYLPKTVNPSDEDLYAEILEINDAINYMYGYPQDIREDTIEIRDDAILDNVNSIAKMLGV